MCGDASEMQVILKPQLGRTAAKLGSHNTDTQPLGRRPCHQCCSGDNHCGSETRSVGQDTAARRAATAAHAYTGRGRAATRVQTEQVSDLTHCAPPPRSPTAPLLPHRDRTAAAPLIRRVAHPPRRLCCRTASASAPPHSSLAPRPSFLFTRPFTSYLLPLTSSLFPLASHS
jgi:hypothetical protein